MCFWIAYTHTHTMVKYLNRNSLFNVYVGGMRMKECMYLWN